MHQETNQGDVELKSKGVKTCRARIKRERTSRNQINHVRPRSGGSRKLFSRLVGELDEWVVILFDLVAVGDAQHDGACGSEENQQSVSTGNAAKSRTSERESQVPQVLQARA